MTHHVYRLIGPCDSLLYVGCTSDLVSRIRKHRCRFGALLVTYESEPYATRAEALDAERVAIELEAPAFNIAHQPSRRTSFDPMGEYVLTEAAQRGYGLRDLSRASGVPLVTLTRSLGEFERFRLPDLEAVAAVLEMSLSGIVQRWEAAA